MFFAGILFKSHLMKKETGVIIAAGIGLLAVIGIMGIRRFLNLKDREYYDYYSDHHQNFEKRFRSDDYYGVEYL